MTEYGSENRFIGSIPEIYDRLMVPMIFAEAASLLARKVAARRPETVLETAAGTGVLTQELLDACEVAEIIATDLNQPMLDRASERVGQDSRVRFQQADALELPFDDQLFDVVACQFGVMFFPDRVRGYREALRVLRPGGALVFNVWDRLENNEFAWITSRALEQLSDVPLNFMSRVPHGYYEPDKIRGDVNEAGFDITSFDLSTPSAFPLQPTQPWHSAKERPCVRRSRPIPISHWSKPPVPRAMPSNNDLAQARSKEASGPSRSSQNDLAASPTRD